MSSYHLKPRPTAQLARRERPPILKIQCDDWGIAPKEGKECVRDGLSNNVLEMEMEIESREVREARRERIVLT